MKHSSVFYSGIAGVLLFVISVILAGLLLENYSHISQLISESYAIDTPYGYYSRYFGFLPAGICMVIFSFLLIKVLPSVRLLKTGIFCSATFYGCSTIIVSFFPCDAGCNKEFIDPTISQLIHNLTGLLTYILVPSGLILTGIALSKISSYQLLSKISLFSGILFFVFFGIMSANLDSPFTGLLQRTTESIMLGWIIICSFTVERNKSINYNAV